MPEKVKMMALVVAAWHPFAYSSVRCSLLSVLYTRERGEKNKNLIKCVTCLCFCAAAPFEYKSKTNFRYAAARKREASMDIKTVSLHRTSNSHTTKPLTLSYTRCNALCVFIIHFVIKGTPNQFRRWFASFRFVLALTLCSCHHHPHP